jgi:hypothetical protein
MKCQVVAAPVVLLAKAPPENAETRANDLDPIWRAGLCCPFRAYRLEFPSPGLKPWAQFWSPFREEICTASLMLLTRMGAAGRAGANPYRRRRSASVLLFSSWESLLNC